MEWRTVVDFPDYLVSEDGVVKTDTKQYYCSVRKRGYMRVRLNRDKKRYDVGVHQSGCEGVCRWIQAGT